MPSGPGPVVHVTSIVVAIGIMAIPCTAPAQTLDEIVVTATKREESIQDIPISLVSVSGEKIRNDVIRDIGQLSVRIPNLSVNKGLTTENIHIRGIGSGDERSFEQAVAMYVDDVYMPRSRQYRAPFLDVERVEVARGPQAVLFGLNATAGAIAVRTARSQPGDPFFANIIAEYESEYGGTALTTVLGGSPHDDVGLRLAAKIFDSGDGYWSNIVTGTDENHLEDTLLRGSLTWQPSDNATLDAKLEYSEFERDGFVDELFTANGSFSDGVDQLNWTRGQDGTLLPLFRNPASPGFAGDLLNVTASLDYSIGGGTVTGIFGYSDYEWELYSDLDSTGLPMIDTGIIEQHEQASIELRYASPDEGPVQFLLGGYLSTNTLDNQQPNLVQGDILLAGAGFPVAGFDAGRLWSDAQFHQDEDLFSVFGTLTWSVSDEWQLRGGVRYVRSDKDHLRSGECLVRRSDGTFDEPDPAGNPNDSLLVGTGFCPTVIDPPARSRSSENVMPEVGLQWNVSPSMMMYVKGSTSAKSGGFVASTVITPEFFEFDDENGLGVEAGFKTGFDSGAGTFDVALFHTEYDDLQINSFDPDTAAAIVNSAGEARSQGIEMDVRWAATDSLSLGGAFAWLDTEFTRFDSGPCYPGEPLNPDGSSCNKTGMSLPFAPEYSGNVFADLVLPLGRNLDLLGGINIAFSDSYFTNGTLDPIAIQGSYSKINARIGLGADEGKWSVSLVGKNITDEVINGSTEAFLGVYRGYIQEPRTVWLQGRYQFGGSR